MSYLVLARKSRPQRFSEVIGQQAVVRTLKNALEQNRVPHALIFSGVRGTGKTTLARIMAKALNCENRQGVEPCDACPSCLDIKRGGSVDLQEVDGASNRGIQEIRELKERIRFQPSASRFKIFIIDEVHMLTTEAFNALLKTLEEPPEHVYFMFATTELHKVPLTILSRCQRFELKRLSLGELRAHFAGLAEQEGVSISPEAVDMVAREAAGSVRDGLSLLDQIFSYCGNSVSETDVREVLGLVSRQAVAGLGTALLEADLARALTLLAALQDQGVDIKRLADELLGWFRDLLLCKLGRETAALLQLPEEELAALTELVRPHAEARLSALFNLLMDAMEQRHFARDPRPALELAFIRAVQTAEITPTAELIERFNALLGDGGEALPSPRTRAASATQAAPRTVAAAPDAVSPHPPAPLSQREREDSNSPLPLGEGPGVRAEGAAQPHDKASSSAPSAPETNAPPAASLTVADPAAAPEAPPSARKSAATRRSAKKTAEEPPLPEAPPPDMAADMSADMSADMPPVFDEVPPPAPASASAENTPDPARLSARVNEDWSAFADAVQTQAKYKWMAIALRRAKPDVASDGALTLLFPDMNECAMLKQPAHARALLDKARDFFQARFKEVRIETESDKAGEINPLTGRTHAEERRALAAEPLVQIALEVFSGQLGEIRTGPGFGAPPEDPGEDAAKESPAEDAPDSPGMPDAADEDD